MSKIMIPVGIENFEMIRTNNFYYIDKTSFIVELVQDAFSVNLITRPRRFGKTLMMRMAESFFDIRKDNSILFEGLEVAKHQDICDGWMNQWPTLFVSFKDVAAENGFEDAYSMLAGIISDVCKEHIYLLDSQLIDENDKDTFIELKSQSASKTDIKRSLLLLMRMMHLKWQKIHVPRWQRVIPFLCPKGFGWGIHQRCWNIVIICRQNLKQIPGLQFC